MYSGFLGDLRLLQLAYDLEQELQPRGTPAYLGALPPEPPDADICAAPSAQATIPQDAAQPRRHLGTGKPLPRR
jgi:hypothetical protein